MSILLGAAELEAALLRLGELAQDQGETIELQIVGGAVMVMDFGSRKSTRDVDVVACSMDRETLSRLAQQVAKDANLPETWIGDGAARYAIRRSQGSELLNAPGIRVSRASIEQLLAMKLWAMRDDVDRDDAIVLARELGLNRESTELAIAPYVPNDDYQRACEELADLWEEIEDA